MKTWALVAAAAMGVVACQNEFQDDYQPSGQTVVVNFVAQSADTKTSVNTEGEVPVFAWGDAETFAVLEQTDALASASSVTYEKVDGKANITAEFAANAGKGEYKYVTIYPAGAYVSAESLSKATLNLPAQQTMAEGSYDPNADLMVSEVVIVDAQPSEAQMVSFTRMAAVVKMSLKNLGLELGDKVQSVTFTADGKTLAGNIVADLAAPNGFTAGTETSSSVTVNTTSAGDVYFTVLPTVLEAGDTYAVTVITDKKLYIKKGTLAEGKTLEFAKGMVTRFGVNMQDVVPSDKWVLVRDASTLKQGDVVTFVAKDYDKAISKKLYSNASETSTSARRDAVDVSKYQDYLIAGTDVQQFVLVNGSAAGTFAFYDEARDKFLVSTNSSSRYLINQPYISAETSFGISVKAEDGEATVKHVKGKYPDNRIQYYNSSKYFFSGTNSNQAICVYKLDGATGVLPVVDANVTVPDSDEPVVIAEEGSQTATTIEEVVFNYVGDWTISASASESWLTVSYADGKFSYTAEANTGAKREAIVTITATREGSETLTWSFNVLQKGVPQEITIAEFMTKKSDVNTTYKLTGLITEASSSSNGTYKLSDGKGNVATITNLYTDASNKVYGDESIGLKVGDVVTLTTVAATSTAGKGGSSSYPSIYKGHYGLNVKAGLAVDYTGGTVNIDVETYSNGTITLPEAVVGSMAENDFAEFSYDGGNAATVSFTSENTGSAAREATVTFTYGLASFSVTVQQGINPANKLGYELVTDASDLDVGDEVIIVSKNYAKALASPTSTSPSGFPVVEIEKTGNVIYDVEEAGVQIFTLSDGVSEGTMAFDFTYETTGYRLYDSSNKLKMRATSYAVNAATSWTISIDDVDGDATITSTDTTPYLIKFNSATGTGFTLYQSGTTNGDKEENAVCIYKKQVK